MTTTVRLPNSWRPRSYQLASWRAWEQGCKRELLVWHRRAGKDDVALHKAAVAAHLRPANYWHMLPEYAQARKAVWDAVNPHSGKRRIDEAFPHELRSRTDSQTMTIGLKCGSQWGLVGSDRPDSLVGSTLGGLTYSEWALSNPTSWAYLAPILAESGGWASFITTPRGRNHVKSMLDGARKDDWRNGGRWWSEVLTIDDTGVISREVVEEARAEYHALYGEEAGNALIEQEYYCSFEASVLGAYYGKELIAAEKEGRICKVEWARGVPVNVSWDIGVSDYTSLWCYQEFHGRINVLASYSATDYAVDHYVDWLNDQPWAGGYGWDAIPPDARQREWTNAGPDGLAKTRVMTMKELGRNPRVLPSQRVADGINAARRVLRVCYFDEERCASGLEALREYRREWDDNLKMFKDTPLHNWASHPADSFRYLALATTNVPAPQPEQQAPQIRGPRTFNEMIRMQQARRGGMERV